MSGGVGRCKLLAAAGRCFGSPSTMLVVLGLFFFLHFPCDHGTSILLDVHVKCMLIQLFWRLVFLSLSFLFYMTYELSEVLAV